MHGVSTRSSENRVLIADLHVHLYPHFSLEKAFHAAFRNLQKMVDEHLSSPILATKALFLTERADCFLFSTLSSASSVGGYTTQLVGEGVVEVVSPEGDSLYIVEGRQIITAERLEILSLGVDPRCQDGVSLEEGIDRIIVGGGIPVIPWSFGKWWFERGKVLREYLSTREGDLFPLLGDIPLRCTGGELHEKFRTQRRVLSGSDPLPLLGEEGGIGSFVSVFEGGIRLESPLESLLEVVYGGVQLKVSVGRRNSPLEALGRLQRLKRGRVQPAPSVT